MSDEYDDIPTRTDSLLAPGVLNPHLWNKGQNQQTRPGLLRRAESAISGGRMGGSTLEARLEQMIDFIEGLGWDPGRAGPFKAQVLGPYINAEGAPGYITMNELRDLGCAPLTSWLDRLSSNAQTPSMLPAVYATIPELDVARPNPQAGSGTPAIGASGDGLAISTYRLFIADPADPPSMPHDGSIIEVDFLDKDSNLQYGIFKSIVVEADIADGFNYNTESTEEDSPSAAFANTGTGADGEAPETMGEKTGFFEPRAVGIGTKEQRQQERERRQQRREEKK